MVTGMATGFRSAIGSAPRLRFSHLTNTSVPRSRPTCNERNEVDATHRQPARLDAAACCPFVVRLPETVAMARMYSPARPGSDAESDRAAPWVSAGRASVRPRFT